MARSNLKPKVFKLEKTLSPMNFKRSMSFSDLDQWSVELNIIYGLLIQNN